MHTFTTVDRTTYHKAAKAAARDFSGQADGKTLVAHYDATGRIIAAAAYGISDTPVYRVASPNAGYASLDVRYYD